MESEYTLLVYSLFLFEVSLISKEMFAHTLTVIHRQPGEPVRVIIVDLDPIDEYIQTYAK